MKDSAKVIGYVLGAFVESVGPETPPKKLTREHVEDWLCRPVADATKRNQLSMVRSWCRWMVAHDLITRDPTLGVVGPPEPHRLPRGLTPEQVDAVFAESPDTRSDTILSLMLEEGLRAAEVAKLELGDINFQQRLALVHGKGRRERVLPLSDQTLATIGHYLAEYPATTGPLIRSYKHPRSGIAPPRVSRLVSQWMSDAGLAETGHSCRHTALGDMLLAGAHIRDVQAAAGHQSVATTEKYLPWQVNDLRVAMGGRSYGPWRSRPTQQAGPGPAVCAHEPAPAPSGVVLPAVGK